jgi:hypothetical protein
MRSKKASPRSSSQGRQVSSEKVAGGTTAAPRISERTQNDDERWLEDIAILRRAAEELAKQSSSRGKVPNLASDNSLYGFFDAVGYSSKASRNEAVRSLYNSNPERVASFLKAALRESTEEQRRKIAEALLDSGLVGQALRNLTDETGRESYSAFSLLFLAAKSGVIQPLISVIESHPSSELPLRLIGLLVSSGVPEVLPAFRRLAASKSLKFELQPAIVEAIHQLNIQIREAAA